jgi:hypothetical protein
MNFSVTTVFTPMERAELKKQFHQKKKMDAQLNKVGQQAARYYKSTVEVKRVSRRHLASASTAGVQAEESLREAEQKPSSA